MIKIIVKKEIKTFFPYKNLFKKIFKEVIKKVKIVGDIEVNVIIIDNKKMQIISKKYRAKDQPTDVLAFQADWKNLSKFIGYFMLGDIFISKEMVILQAKKNNHSIKREWAYLFLHGALHLLGYNHINKVDEKIMNSIASYIMKKVRIDK